MSEHIRKVIALLSISVSAVTTVIALTYEGTPTNTSIAVLSFAVAAICFSGITHYDPWGDPIKSSDPTGETTKSWLIHILVVGIFLSVIWHLFYYWILNPGSNIFFTWLFDALFIPNPQ